MKLVRGLLSAAWLALISGFSCEALADLEDGKLKVFVSNYPLAYFAERIGGHRVAVSLPVPAGEDPAFWRPDPEAISRMQKADLIALNGADYEKWLNRVSLPRLKQVDTSAGFKAAYIRIENAVTHSHGPGGEHSHDGIAFTTWLDLAQAGKQAEALALGVIRKRPELKAVFLENLSGLQADLKVLDDELLKLGEAKKNQPLLGSHPVYQYLARRYGLNLKSVHWEPNEMPPAAEWVALDETLIRHPARTMIWEAQPSPEIAARLKEKGVSSAVLDPCAQRPEQGDFLSVMQANIANLESTP